ncbi:MAG: OmpA family protein [Hyphomonadaceae bacterium]|nr:OmpA family protein [Hyphomonadaceae bacterium]
MTEPAVRRPSLFVIGAAGAALAALAGMLGVHGGSVWRLPQVLEQRVETALQAAGQGGLEVRMDGQRAILSGIVEEQGAIANAQRAALAAAGAGGPWAGGVTHVDVAGVAVGRFDRPYFWSVRREGARVVLSGAVPSDAARADLMSTAAAAFPNAETVDDMHVAGGAASARFGEIARRMLRGLARLSSGEARIADSQIAFIGDGGEEAVAALRREFANPPAPFRARLDVTTDGLDTAHPELQGLNLQTGDAQTCEAAFERLTERNVINFAPGSAAIDPSSRQLLDALASVALRCDRFTIEVAGHTDDQGGRELNMALSQRRAETVVSYLASQGVARSRLTARGYGADRPRASNATPAGQAANRRIEFNVSS